MDEMSNQIKSFWMNCAKGNLKNAYKAAKQHKMTGISEISLPFKLFNNNNYREAFYIIAAKFTITQLKHNAHHTAGNYVERDALAAELVEFKKAFISCYNANVEDHVMFFETAKKILVNELGETSIPWEKQMITVKDLMSSPVNSSPDGKHWEPSLWVTHWWSIRIRDALAVLQGKAVAIRQTTKEDLKDKK